MKSQCHLWKLVMRKMGNESPRCKWYILLLGSMWHIFLDEIGLRYSTWTYCVRYTYVIWTPFLLGALFSQVNMVMHFASENLWHSFCTFTSIFQGPEPISGFDSHQSRAALRRGHSCWRKWTGRILNIRVTQVSYGGSYLSKLRYAALNIRDSWVNNLASFESSRKIDVSLFVRVSAIVRQNGTRFVRRLALWVLQQIIFHRNWSWTIYRHGFQRFIL